MEILSDTEHAMTTDESRRWHCPKCGSQQTQRLSIIQSSGTTAINMISAGIGTGGSSVAAGIASSSGTSVSALAAQLSPPKKPENLSPAMLAVAGLIIGMLISIFFSPDSFSYVLLAGGATAFMGFLFGRALTGDDYQMRLAAYRQALQVWERSFLCMRCGERFEVL